MAVQRTIGIVIFILNLSILLISCTTQAIGFSNSSKRHRLLQDLINGYPQGGKYVIPRKSQVEAVSVQLSVGVTKVLHVDQQKETVTLRVQNTFEWRDEFLAWDPDNYGGISTTLLPTQQLWLPDIGVFDIESEECTYDDKAVVYSAGTVLWVPSCIQEIGCHVDPMYFPFDKHKCEYRLGSWMYSNESLILESGGVQHTKSESTQEWSLFGINSHMEHTNWGSGIYPKIVISYRIHHHAPLFAFLLIFPAVLLSIMTSVVFLLPTDDENKINVGMSIFLSFMVLLHILMDSTPKSSVTVPYLGYYFSLNSLLIAMSVFSATITSNLCAKAAAGHLMQTWAKNLLSLMAKLTWVDISTTMLVTPKDASRVLPVKVNDSNGSNNQRKNDWMLFATALDRFLFLIFVVANICITAAIFSKYSHS